MADGDEIRLGKDGVRIGWVYAALMAVALGGAAWWSIAVGAYTLVGAYGLPVLILLTLVLRLTRLGDDELVLGDEELLARTDGQERRWRWDEILEITVSKADFSGPYTAPGCTVWVRPEGRAFDVPGPNALFPVTIPVFGLRAHRRLRRRLEQACTAHGVPFSRGGLRVAIEPRPDSPLRTRPAGPTSRDASDAP